MSIYLLHSKQYAGTSMSARSKSHHTAPLFEACCYFLPILGLKISHLTSC